MATLGHAVTFTVGDQSFAIVLDHIKSIEPFVLSERASADSKFELGKSNIRNEEVSVLDLEGFLFNRKFEETESTKILFISAEAVKAAIAVTNGEIVNGSGVELQSIGLAGTKDNKFFSNVVLLNDELIPVIDPVKLIESMQLVVS